MNSGTKGDFKQLKEYNATLFVTNIPLLKNNFQHPVRRVKCSLREENIDHILYNYRYMHDNNKYIKLHVDV